MKRIAFFFVFSLVLAACSTVKLETRSSAIPELPIKNGAIKSMEMKAKLTAKFGDDLNSATCKIYLAGADSVSMSLFGPLGIALGKLYAEKHRFLFYNVFENIAIEGEPSWENFRRAMNLNVSFEDFVSFSRSSAPGNSTEYKLFSVDSIKDEALFRRMPADTLAEYVLVSLKSESILQFQRKAKSGALLVNAFFREYNETQGYSLADKIVIDFPEADASLTFEVSSRKINGVLPNLKFDIPDGIKRINLNE